MNNALNFTFEPIEKRHLTCIWVQDKILSQS